MPMDTDHGNLINTSFSNWSSGVGSRLEGKRNFGLIDSTTIDLCLSIFDWARFRRTQGAIKLHLLLDHDGYLPEFAWITEGKVVHPLHFVPGTIVVDDRGDPDYAL